MTFSTIEKGSIPNQGPCPLPDLSADYSPGLGRLGNREASCWEEAGSDGQ